MYANVYMWQVLHDALRHKTLTGAVKSFVRIAQVVPQLVRTSGNFQEFTI